MTTPFPSLGTIWGVGAWCRAHKQDQKKTYLGKWLASGHKMPFHSKWLISSGTKQKDASKIAPGEYHRTPPSTLSQMTQWAMAGPTAHAEISTPLSYKKMGKKSPGEQSWPCAQCPHSWQSGLHHQTCGRVIPMQGRSGALHCLGC